jgi:hypothetical protein
MLFNIFWAYLSLLKLFLWAGMPKRLCELITKDKKFYILCFGPNFLLQVFCHVRVLEWERGLYLSWSTHVKLSKKVL